MKPKSRRFCSSYSDFYRPSTKSKKRSTRSCSTTEPHVYDAGDGGRCVHLLTTGEMCLGAADDPCHQQNATRPDALG